MKTPRAPRVPEKVVQAQIVALLRSVGGAVYVLGTRRRRGDYQGTMQTPGIPDVFVVLPPPPGQRLPFPVWIEVKAAGGRASPEQEAFETLVESCKETYYVRGGVDDVIAFLIDNGWLKKENVPHYRQPQGVTP